MGRERVNRVNVNDRVLRNAMKDIIAKRGMVGWIDRALNRTALRQFSLVRKSRPDYTPGSGRQDRDISREASSAHELHDMIIQNTSNRKRDKTCTMSR